MASFNLRDNNIFTFHYASTLSILVSDLPAIFPWFTFHYASTLSVPVYKYEIYASTFTFHYASTLSRKKSRRCRYKHIYIPLCFYFITWGHPDRHTRQHYLHSTMLLLYPKSGLPPLTASDIYIPLCFYFIQSQLLARREKTNLHSTMLLLYLRTVAARRSALLNLHSTMLLLYLSCWHKR